MITPTPRSHYEWNPADGRIYPGGAALVAVAQDGTEIVLYLDDFDGEVRPSFGLHFPDTREWATTDDCRTWDRVEQYVPRVEWPANINAGKRGPAVMSGPQTRPSRRRLMGTVVPWRRRWLRLISMRPSCVTTARSDPCQSLTSHLLTLHPHLCYDLCRK